jgi:hypothetical protein
MWQQIWEVGAIILKKGASTEEICLNWGGGGGVKHCTVLAQLKSWNSVGCHLVWNLWKMGTKCNIIGMMVWKI